MERKPKKLICQEVGRSGVKFKAKNNKSNKKHQQLSQPNGGRFRFKLKESETSAESLISFCKEVSTNPSEAWPTVMPEKKKHQNHLSHCRCHGPAAWSLLVHLLVLLAMIVIIN